ncbi:MAG TPA: hypothetical protein VL947_02350 [Cytophagales bacterium]|nr:hypothetical protein [Cytophagales bacterium]
MDPSEPDQKKLEEHNELITKKLKALKEKVADAHKQMLELQKGQEKINKLKDDLDQTT